MSRLARSAVKVSLVRKEDVRSLRASPGQRKFVLARCPGGLARRLIVEAVA